MNTPTRLMDFFNAGGVYFGPALELLTGFATAPGATFTALTMAAGNSATVRQAPDGKMIRLINLWSDAQGAGNFRVRSPKIHDAVQGIRVVTTVAEVHPLLAFSAMQRLYPNDPLTLDITGSAVAGDIETACLLVYYEDLPGVSGRFISPEEVMRRIVNVFTVENTLALGTAGGYSGEEALNAEFDLGKANIDYALIGYQVSIECAAVRWRGADTGNVGVGGPGPGFMQQLTGEWFLRLSRLTGMPLVPVFNYTNRAGILVDGAQDENGADVTLTSIFAELAAR